MSSSVMMIQSLIQINAIMTFKLTIILVEKITKLKYISRSNVRISYLRYTTAFYGVCQSKKETNSFYSANEILGSCRSIW